MKNNICPKCGSQEIVPNVEVRDYDAGSYRPLSIFVELPKPPGALIYKGSESSLIRAWVCGDCGYTELYAARFKELLAAHKQTSP